MSLCVQFILVSILILVLQVTQCHKIHECVHDHLEEQELLQMNVNYENHPYHKNEQETARRLLTPSLTSPIRISAYYDPVTISSTNLNATQINYIKSLVSSTTRYYSQFVNVVPVSGPFYVAVRGCDESYSTEWDSIINCVDYSESFVCGDVTIPQDHYAEEYLYFYPKNTTATKLPGGAGVSDTDLLLYVSYTADGCDNYTLAYARPCRYDQYGRPVAGAVNICPGMLNNAEYWKMDINALVHEVAHIIIMHPLLWYGFHDSNGDSMALTDIVDETDPMGDGLSYIITTNVKELARKHYNCATLPGLPLENTGAAGSVGSHWDEKYAHSALMGATAWTGLMYFTDLTFALMEDSGWYSVNYNYSEPFYWGENAGCELWSDTCVDSSSYLSNYAQYYCHSLSDDGCTYDYSAPGGCVYYTHGEALPAAFRYFSDSTHGGPEASDFCPFRNTRTIGDYESVCWDLRGNTLTDDTYPPAQDYAINSRCVDIIDNGLEAGYCFEHQCFGYDAINQQWDGVSIAISSTETVNCTRSEEPGYAFITTKSAVSISVDLNCPDIDAICGKSSQPFACYWGHYSDDLSQCICSAGYTGSQCDIQDTSIEAELQLSEEESTPSPISTSLCVDGFSRRSLNDEYSTDGEWNFYPKWASTTMETQQYVFWNIFLHRWIMYKEIDSTSWSAMCNVSAWTQNITDCNGNWYVWFSYDGVAVLEPDATTYIGGCTAAPTPAPIYRNISIDLEYVNYMECNLSSVIDVVSNYTMYYLNVTVAIELSVDVENYINDSVVYIKYIMSVQDETVVVLEEIENIIVSDSFRLSLMNKLSSNTDCFEFITEISTTETLMSTTEDTEEDEDGGIQLLDWENYNTMELAIVLAIAIVGLVIIGVMIYGCVKCCNNCDGDSQMMAHNANAASVYEFKGDMM